MKWVNMTDALFFRAFDYTFMITKERSLGCHDWFVFKDEQVVHKGSSAKLGAAKLLCKDLYKQYKAENKTVKVKANGKLTYR